MLLLIDFLRGLVFSFVAGTIAHFIGEAIPRRLFRYEEVPFRCAAWERQGRVYNGLRVSRWASRLPDMSRHIPYMFPKRLKPHMTSDDYLAFVTETCVAEMTHAALILSSPILLLVTHTVLTGVVFMLIYSLCNLPFIIIQRYNRPRLVRLYRRQLYRETALEKERCACESLDSVV